MMVYYVLMLIMGFRAYSVITRGHAGTKEASLYVCMSGTFICYLVMVLCDLLAALIAYSSGAIHSFDLVSLTIARAFIPLSFPFVGLLFSLSIINFLKPLLQNKL